MRSTSLRLVEMGNFLICVIAKVEFFNRFIKYI